ncbi:hypothetical protein C4D60_Mb06t20140 [Musa balbisiana]|uniref:CCAAT-binding factor domain-containing protein n=1 Tax=Musa balbisiana TaxID=52838 RepID=A0A4S8IPE3_MUSBA|nr:hypothetical protein C4D60_Mb06t20140 [Musa balbisiana]
MGKKNKVILPPNLPPEVADDEIEVSDEDLEFVGRNRQYVGFLTKLDTKSIDRHVKRVANHEDDELEALYEKRNRKPSLLRLKEEEDKLQVDPVDALPVKTLDGKLEYRTADRSKSGDGTNEKESAMGIEDDEKNAGMVKLTKPEKRLKLKKSRKEAKKLAKVEEKGDGGEEKLHSEVLLVQSNQLNQYNPNPNLLPIPIPISLLVARAPAARRCRCSRLPRAFPLLAPPASPPVARASLEPSCCSRLPRALSLLAPPASPPASLPAARASLEPSRCSRLPLLAPPASPPAARAFRSLSLSLSRCRSPLLLPPLAAAAAVARRCFLVSPSGSAKVEEDLSAEELFRKKKIRLAEIGLQLLENPEENIKALKELLQICDDEDQNIVKLGLMSLLAVFKDIIPGYRIRLPSEKEMEMTVSKAVHQQRFYESTLLRSYKAYLMKLITLEKQPSIRQVAVRCLCSLLDAVPHFNFRESILATVVKNISSSDDTIRKLCCEAIRSIFSNEGKHGGEATLEAVRLIADHVKFHDCQLHPDSIDVFLSLTFDEDIGKSDVLEEPVKPKKRGKWKNQDGSKEVQGSDRKKNKQELMKKTREEVSADLKAVSFAPDSKDRKMMQSETLSAVFETYFRILKHSMDPSASRSKVNAVSLSCGSGSYPLLASCLNGLGKFSHLIDLDFMGDLLECLKKLAGYSDHNDGSMQNHLSVSERLQCCIVAFMVMRNNLDALNVDLQDFFVQLYNLLLEYRPDRDCGEVLAKALKTMLWEGKQHDMQRAAAFIKRLATFSLSFGSAEAMAALVTVKHLLQKNSKCRNLLENDAGGGSLAGLVAKYRPDATDPNISGALASVLWELGLLVKHYNPSISSMAASISSMANMNTAHSQVLFSTASPLQAFADLSIERELFKPASKAASLRRKRTREIEKDFVVMDPDQIRKYENMIDEDVLTRKFKDHFILNKGIMENERLRRELNHTMSSISLYEDYKRQKKHKKER